LYRNLYAASASLSLWCHSKPSVETIENSLAGIISALRAAGRPEHFRGVAIYASFTTDEAKWSIYDRLWRDAEPVTLTPPPDPRNTTLDPPAR